MKRTRLIIRIVVSILLLAVILFKVDFTDALGFFKNLDALSIAFVMAVSVVLILLSAYKWKIFLEHFQIKVPLWRLFTYYVIGYFFNNFLPSNVGGDAVRFMLTASKGRKSYSDSLVAVFMERFTGMIALLVFGLVAIPLALYQLDFLDSVAYVLPAFAAACAGVGMVLFFDPAYISRINLSNRHALKVRDKLVGVLNKIQTFKQEKRIFAYALILSIVFNILAVVNVFTAAWVLDIPVGVYELFICVPIILVISAIPLSLNGIGITEGAYVLCLTHIGVTAPAALSIALLLRAKNIIISVLGGGLFLVMRRDEVPTEKTAEGPLPEVQSEKAAAD